MKTFKFKKYRRGYNIPVPVQPTLQNTEDQELLEGQVNDMKASAPEERLAKALKDADIKFLFRYVVGAPKGLPGWKELDFAVFHNGMVYATEVDTAFTHRTKAMADILHDAIVLNDNELQTLGQIYPMVFHVDGDSDLATQANARAYVRRTFGR